MSHFTFGPFGKPLDSVAQTYQEIHNKSVADKVEEKPESSKDASKEVINESKKKVTETAQNRFFTQLAAKVVFGKQGVENLNTGKCPQCGGSASGFRDDISAREHKISGLCQKCQDENFAEPKEETVNEDLKSRILRKLDHAIFGRREADNMRQLYQKMGDSTLGYSRKTKNKDEKEEMEKLSQHDLRAARRYYKISQGKPPFKEETVNESRRYVASGDWNAETEDEGPPKLKTPRLPDSDREGTGRRHKKTDPNYDTTKERDMDLKEAIWPKYDVQEPKPGVTIRSTTIPKEKQAEYGKDVVTKGIAAGKWLKKQQQEYYAQRKAELKARENKPFVKNIDANAEVSILGKSAKVGFHLDRSKE